jgi:hypothetical protein
MPSQLPLKWLLDRDASAFHFGAVLSLLHTHHEDTVIQLVVENAPDLLSGI